MRLLFAEGFVTPDPVLDQGFQCASRLSMPSEGDPQLHDGVADGPGTIDGVEIPLHMAKAQIGSALRRAIKRTEAAMKEFGDSGQVTRFCDGDVPSVFARAWARPETRRELVTALAEASGFYEAETTLRPKKRSA
jgi:hypothetical protein